jgi:DNA-binding CsgD family transcriptional regulator
MVEMEDLFVGRVGELAALAQWLSVAVAGEAMFVLVEGEGGCGKTALLARFQRDLGPYLVVRATGDESESTLPLGVFDQLIQELAANPGEAREAGRAGGTDYPGVGGTLRDPLVAGEILRELVSHAQKALPVIVLIEDVHLTDHQSLTALTYACRRWRHERVLVVLTARPEFATQTPPGLSRLIGAGGARLKLQGLQTPDVQRLAIGCGLGHMTDRAATRLRDHTNGNPLYLRSLMAELTADQLEQIASSLPAPRSFSYLVLASLGKAMSPARSLAAAAAVLGRRCNMNDAVRIAAIEDPLSSIQQLDELNILHLKQNGEDNELVFVHPLVRAAVYEAIGAKDRAVLHGKAGALCSGRQSLWHRVRAASGPNPRLVEALQAQAASDRGCGAWAAAAALLFDAMRLTPTGDTRERLLVDAVELLLLDGDLAEAIRHAKDMEQLPDNAHKLQVEARIAWLAGRREDARSLAAAAWSRARDLDPRTRDDVAAMLAQMCILSTDGAGAVRWAREALSSGLLPPNQAATTRATGAIGLAMTGRVREGFELLGEPAGRGAETGYRADVGARGMLRLWTDDLVGARTDLRAAMPIPGHGSGAGREPYRLVALGYLVEAEYRIGSWDQATSLAEQAVSSVEDTGQTWLTAFMHSIAVLVPAARGDWSAATHHLQAARLEADVDDHVSRAYADNAAVHVAACRADAPRVVELSRWLLSDARGNDHEPGFLGWSVHHASALVELKMFREAEQRLSMLERIARARGRQSRLASLARVRGELAAALHETGIARTCFEDALRIGRHTADSLERAMVRAAYGSFLRRRGERRAARDQLVQARDAFESLGALPFLERLVRELAACGVTPETDMSKSPLTPQETAVMRLICRGKTNRQTADELHLSIKTVTYHLGHVFDKLDVRSRAELIARFGSRFDRGGT